MSIFLFFFLSFFILSVLGGYFGYYKYPFHFFHSASLYVCRLHLSCAEIERQTVYHVKKPRRDRYEVGMDRTYHSRTSKYRSDTDGYLPKYRTVRRDIFKIRYNVISRYPYRISISPYRFILANTGFYRPIRTGIDRYFQPYFQQWRMTWTDRSIALFALIPI